MIINELITKLSFSLDQRTINRYDSSMRRMERQAATATSNMHRSFSRSSSGIARMLNFNVRLHGVGSAISSLNKINSQAAKVGNALKSLSMNMIIGGGAAVGAAAVGGASKVFQAGVEYENLNAALVTVTGSQAKANKEFSRLEAFASKTPFQLNEIVRGFITLKSLNLDSSNYAFEQLGNIAGARAISLNQVVEAVSDATTFDFERVKEAFKITYENDAQAGIVTFTDPLTKTKTVVKRDAQEIQKYLLSLGNNFKGGMSRMSATTGGQLSNLQDSFDAAMRSIWNSGAKYPVASLIKNLSDVMTKNKSKFVDFGKAIDAWAERATVGFYKLKDGLKAVKPWIEPVAIGLGMIATHMIAMKGIAIAGGVFKFLGLLTSIGGGTIGLLTTAFGAVSGFITFASGAGLAGTLGAIGTTLGGLVTAALPILGSLLTGGVIVGAIALIVALGVKLADYWARGDAALVGLRDKFPGLADGIKVIGDEMAAWWPIIQNVLIGGFNLLWPVIKWCFEGVLVPVVSNALKFLGMVSSWIRTAYEFWMPMLTNAFVYWKEALAPIFNWIGEQFDKLFGWLGKAGEIAGNVFGAIGNVLGVGSDFGMGGGGAGGGVGGAGLASTAINFVKSGQADKYAFSLAKANGFVTKSLFQQGIACAQTTDQLLKMAGASKAVQDAMTASAPGSYAALKGRGLASSVSEKDLKPGDLVFYNPGGKGIQHVGVYVGDGMVVDASNAAGKQIGTGQRVVLRKNWMAGNANYLRINDNQWMMPAPGGGMGGGGGGVVNNIKVDARGATNPEAVKAAAKDGTGQALNKAAKGKNKPVGAVRG